MKDLTREILQLKKEKKAVILAHNYMIGPVQDLADFVGDSLGLSQQAAATDSPIIVFCGVHFMAETASIFWPQKKCCSPVWTQDVPWRLLSTAGNFAVGGRNTPAPPCSPTSTPPPKQKPKT